MARKLPGLSLPASPPGAVVGAGDPTGGPDVPDLALLRTLAGALAWPKVALGTGRTVGPGEGAWERFLDGRGPEGVKPEQRAALLRRRAEELRAVWEGLEAKEEGRNG